jgi:hypothetical protein
MMRPPLASSVRSTLGSCLLVEAGWASVRFSPVRSTCFLTITGRPLAIEEFLGAEGHGPAAEFGRAAFGALVDQAHLQRGGAAQDVLGLGRVLHAGQLHDDAVQALLLDHRLGHAEFVDPVVQRGDVLLERGVLQAARGLGLDGGHQRQSAAVLAVGGFAGR